MAGLHELSEREQEICLGVLMEVLGEAVQSQGKTGELDEDLWHAYLSAQWLRPETALIQYAEALAIRHATQSRGPWLDLGCGDGIHAALNAGWRFDSQFDAFQSLDLSNADIYNHFDASQFAVRIERQGSAIAHGVDIKETAIARARALGAFESVQRANATKLPIADRSIQVIFSNMLRDLGDPLPGALAECRRVLRDDGVVLISAMTPAYQKNLYFAPNARLANEAGRTDEARQLLRLDRGRSVFCQRQLSIDQWQTLLKDQKLRVERAIPIVGAQAIRFWDVGLRPFSTKLLQLRQAWSKSGMLPAMKQMALALASKTLRPIVANVTSGETCMNLLVVRKA